MLARGTSVCATTKHFEVSRQTKGVAVQIPGNWNCLWPSPHWAPWGDDHPAGLLHHTNTPAEQISANKSLSAPFLGWKGSCIAPSIPLCMNRDCTQDTILLALLSNVFTVMPTCARHHQWFRNARWDKILFSDESVESWWSPKYVSFNQDKTASQLQQLE